MHTSKENIPRPRSNLGVRTDWRARPVSPSNGSNSSSGMTDYKRSISPIPDSLSSAGSDSRQSSKYGRRPIPASTVSSSSGAGQSVAALQQHHQWLMQQQDTNVVPSSISRSSHRSVSPAPRSARSMDGSNAKQANKHPQYGAAAPVATTNEDEDVIFDEVDDEDEGDDVEEERMVIIQDVRARSPSINRGSGGSIMSVQPAPSFYHTSPAGPQEFKQWKPVYAVAKHGNAVKPGGLYLYKDIKCTNHIQTYDMSEVLEVSPRAQDYKQGIKWEIRMLVKRDDVILATDDMLSRKDWVDSLTSIMGKVSIATQNELTSRIHTSEQMNRDLQGVAEELDGENQKLREQLQTLKEGIAKKERFFQQELLNRENELKESIAKKERALQQELQDREEELNTEMDRQRQALETKCEIFEREALQWRSKYNELEKKSNNNSNMRSVDHDKMESLEIEVRKWRNRVDELEHQQKKTEYRNVSRNSRSMNSDSFEANDALKETMSDVKFNLQVLRDQIKNSSEAPLLDIRSSVNKLCDTLDDAKLGWNDLQSDIIKFLETERDDADMKDAKQKHMMELLRNDFVDLRQELVGVSVEEDDSEEQQNVKLPSLSEKFDILIQMVENVQISQSRLSSSMMDNNSTSSSDSGMPSTPPLSYADKDSDLYKAVASQQKQLSDWIEESREMQNSTLTTIESNMRQSRSLPSVPSDIGRLHEKITHTIEAAMSEIVKNQQQGQDEQGKNIKVIGNYLQLISNDIQESAIPDLSALSQQLEDVVDRLNTTEERLSMLNVSSMSSTHHQQEDAMSYRNMPPPSPSSAAMSDDDKLSQLHSFVKNTERFMERSLRILSQYGSNPNGMEETIRRAVKGASKTHSEELLVIQEQNKEEREVIEKKMQRYEENARNYFEKSMEKMHTDLHEFTGVMYEMLERLVLKALEQSSSSGATSSFNNEEEQPQQKSIQNVVELYGKLSGLNQVLKAEITRLSQEKEELEATVKSMKKTSKDLEKQIDKQNQQLQSVKSEYERVQRDVQKSRQEGAHDVISKELEPLMEQIAKLRKMAAVNDELSENLSSQRKKQPVRSRSPLPSPRYNVEEEDDKQLRFPTMSMGNRRNSFTSQFSDDSSSNDNKRYDQQSVKSPLIGSRDKPRGRTPLASYLERNNKQ
ncbi:hypothetical protein MAM1_0310d09525 [Mucor ambiguus]|uniref:PH domain-containing protein n=1 Tax=Mucor ambiguus TaxID=91626 RepID=A0A0C9N1V5_9FUNG|nr:hypothetical protein MAM1_0310d09525 [Mucor ambiguus]